VRRGVRAASTLCAVALCNFVSPSEGTAQKILPRESPGTRTALLWRQPNNIPSRDLLHGVGGKENQPLGTFTFIKEDPGGANPKFLVEDSRGRRWKVKLGPEAGVETTATRLLWAMGYFTDEDYFRREISVKGLKRLNRGQEFVSANGTVRGARLERQLADIKKAGHWSWRNNPFKGTREFHGLIVMMSLLNNWDLKTGNNDIYQNGQEYQYLVSDVGAVFGNSNFWRRTKADLKAYRKGKFLQEVSAEEIDLRLPTRPPCPFLFAFPFYIQRTRLAGLAEDMPRHHVEWIGQLLAQLSTQQISDAFRAGGFESSELEGLTQEVQRRISELRGLIAANRHEPGTALTR